ncbi:MAG TPA: hypothetical protein VMV46_01245 [Thermoanaerobaculia bacterium]|nr:hypothetical protein [Thermoanaerobaculia bacterium]
MDATPATRRPATRAAMIFAAVAITVGLWLLLGSFGVDMPSLGTWWPLFLVVGGLASLADFLLLGRQPGSAGHAMIGVGLGLLFFSITLGWTRLLTFWDWFPGIPLVVGLAFLITWLAGGRERGDLLAVGVVFAAIGLVGFVFRYPALRDVLPSGELIWALLLLAGGAWVLWRLFAQRDGR